MLLLLLFKYVLKKPINTLMQAIPVMNFYLHFLWQFFSLARCATVHQKTYTFCEWWWFAFQFFVIRNKSSFKLCNTTKCKLVFTFCESPFSSHSFFLMVQRKLLVQLEKENERALSLFIAGKTVLHQVATIRTSFKMHVYTLKNTVKIFRGSGWSSRCGWSWVKPRRHSETHMIFIIRVTGEKRIEGKSTTIYMGMHRFRSFVF